MAKDSPSHSDIRLLFLVILFVLTMYFVGISWLNSVIILAAIIFLGLWLIARGRVTSNYVNLSGVLAGFLLQLQYPQFSLLAHNYSNTREDPLSFIINIFMCTAVLVDDPSEEKEQTVHWIHWLHRNLQSFKVTDEMRRRFDIQNDISTYGYNEATYAALLDAITWCTLSFHECFGNPLSEHTRDDIVLESACLGMRMGIPHNLLFKDYDTFQASFNHRLDTSQGFNTLIRSLIEKVEVSMLTGTRSYLLTLSLYVGLAVGIEMLPKHVREEYMMVFFKTWHGYIFQRCIIWLVWLVYPIFMTLPPVRVTLCLLLLLDRSTWSLFAKSCCEMLSIDPVDGTPSRTPGETNHAALQWLAMDSVVYGKSFVQTALVYILDAQWASHEAEGMNRLLPWMNLIPRVVQLIFTTFRHNAGHIVEHIRSLTHARRMFQKDIKSPHHVGFVMDGNRRFAKLRGRKAVWGHWKGATTWLNLIDWWAYFNSKMSHEVNYMTLWALSKENLQRSPEELAGLFVVLTATFRSIAFTPSIHRSQIRVRFIGTRAGLPEHVVNAIDLLEKETESYSRAVMLVAVGYGGRDEVLSAVKDILKSGEELNEENVSRKTFCSKISVPPVDLIIRTSESRTSGFMLWDTQSTELHFIHGKLWPELTARDCMHAIESFASRERRGGK